MHREQRQVVADVEAEASGVIERANASLAGGLVQAQSATESRLEQARSEFSRGEAALAAYGSSAERAAAAVKAHTGTYEVFEDEAVGLCARLHRVRLIACDCFYDWAPCDITDPAKCRPAA